MLPPCCPRVHSWLPLGLVALALAGGCASPPPPPPIASAPWHRTELGLCEDYPEETRTLAAARADLAVAHQAGAAVLRIAFGWDAMEPQPGQYDWTFWDAYVAAANQAGVRLIPYVCYTPKWAASDQGENYWRSPPRDPESFARFVAALVQRYHADIHTWELWNEPDNPAYWLGTPAQFAELVRAGSAAVRRTDPSATVVLGGIAGELDFLAKLLRDERLGPAVDVINIHSYFETWHPNPIERLPQYIQSAAGLVQDTGGHQALWMAETGYSSVGGRPDVSTVYRAHFVGEHTEAAQAAALARTLLLGLASAKLDVIAWYRINDLPAGQQVIGDDNNLHLGIRSVEGHAKPALRTFALLAGCFRQPYRMLRPSIVIVPGATAEPVVEAFEFRDGRVLVAAWLPTPEGPAPAVPRADERRAEMRITLPWTTQRLAMFEADGSAPRAGDSTVDQDTAHTTLHWRLRGGEVRLAILTPRPR